MRTEAIQGLPDALLWRPTLHRDVVSETSPWHREGDAKSWFLVSSPAGTRCPRVGWYPKVGGIPLLSGEGEEVRRAGICRCGTGSRLGLQLG